MIRRRTEQAVNEALQRQAAVALLGPRQVGKTTLALELADRMPSVYLDLEAPGDRAKLADAALYLSAHEDKLVILDEIHRAPDLFQTLRGLIDQGRRRGRKAGRFLLLGSASIDVLRQSGESLAGRIAYVEMAPVDAAEVPIAKHRRLWVRGGFPDSFLAANDADSAAWREDFIRTYLERDIAQFGPRIPAETLRRFWTMLAHGQGTLLNAARIAASLGISGQTVTRYTDLLVDLLLVRRLQPWHANSGKRLVRTPKVYVRDTGLLHSLLHLRDHEALMGHPIVGASWEGFVIETLLRLSSSASEAFFYRTSAGAEVDLVLQRHDGARWAIEVKLGLAPKVEKGFHQAFTDLNATRSFVVYPGKERYPLGKDVEAIGLADMMELLLQ